MTRQIATSFLCLAACTAFASAQVHLRGRADPMADAAVRATLEGVIVRSATSGAPPRLLGWDRVRTVDGPVAPAAAPFLPMADLAWRARTRLERGDVPSADALFEQLYPAYRLGWGPSAAVVCEGTARCRLARDDTPGAIPAWLAWLAASRARAEGDVTSVVDWVGGTIDLAPLRDETTDLVPALPPIFLGDSVAQRVCEAGPWDGIGAADPVVAYLGALYRAAAAAELGRPLPAMPTSNSRAAADHQGCRFVADILAARAGDAERRRIARDALERRMITSASTAESSSVRTAWVEAWCRAAIGRSLLKEPDPTLRRRGVMHLLHVPARFMESQPSLAATCLAEAAVELNSQGDDAGAASILSELKGRFPASPQADWTAQRLQRHATPTPSIRPAPSESSHD